MANKVFGSPVTDEVVSTVYPTLLPNQITARHRAEVAFLYRNANGRVDNVTTYVHNLKGAYGDGTSTLCKVFNATGGPVRFSRSHTWEGSVWRSPYPQIIQNGQWGGFLHVRSRLAGPSKEAAVYSGVNNDGQDRGWMICWNTRRMNRANAVYSEVRTTAHFATANWEYMNQRMKQRLHYHSDTWGGGLTMISVGTGSSPELVATLTLDGLEGRFMEMASEVVMAGLPSLNSRYVDEVDEASLAADEAALSDDDE